ncbi:MAG: asparaginase [Pseudomonadota bacterium]
MTDPIVLARLIRGDLEEGAHRGHAVVVNSTGETLAAWGNPNHLIYPRSSCKMLQALPLLESGAAASVGLGSEHLALACASHNGAAIHTNRVTAWLAHLGLAEDDLRCGPQRPNDRDARKQLGDAAPCQIHNNCSGKHAGFLTLSQHLSGEAEYIAPDHPVQLAVRTAFEEMVGETSPGFGIDGCSAPNFACTLHGLAFAMAQMARPTGLVQVRSKAASSLIEAMMRHPDLVAGEGRACTELMRAAPGHLAVKTGAEGVFAIILPDQGLGAAIKVEDGATRASEAAAAALLVGLGVLSRDDPAVARRAHAPQVNRRGIDAAYLVAEESLFHGQGA